MMTSASPASAASSTQRSVHEELVHAAVGLLDDHGPDALQTRKVAAAVGTSTMAVYTHFGGMQGLIAAVAQEGLSQFDTALSIPHTDDPVADLLRCGGAYRRFAIERPHMYRLMFGSTSAHGINAPAGDVLALRVAEIHPSLAHVVQHVHRAMVAGRISAGSPDDDAAVLAIASQFWTMMHGFVMLELAGYYGDGAVEPVLGGLATNTLLSLGDAPEAVAASRSAATQGL